MRRTHRLVFPVWLIGLPLFAGCTPDPPSATPANAAAAVATPTLKLTRLLALRPETRTIVRPYGNGVLVGQCAGDAKGRPEPLRLLGGDDVRAVPFDAAAVAKAAGAAENDVMLRDAWPMTDGRCLVFVNGYSGRRPLAGLWLHRPGGGLTRVADAAELGRVSGLGDSAQLADGRLVGGGRGAWLLLSVFGQTGVIRIGLDGAPAATPTLRLAAAKLIGEDGQAVGIDHASLWPAGDDRALLVRPRTPNTWAIHLPTGVATYAPGGLPPIVVTDEAGGERQWSFTAASDRPRTELDTWAAGPERLPTVTITPPTGPAVVIDRDGLRTRLGFPAYAWRPTAWCPEPRGGRVIAYDAMSGEVFRASPE